MEINKVGVVGCGTMGSGICEVSARGGFEVLFLETSEELLQAGQERINRSVEKAVEREKLERSEADALLGKISSTLDYEDLKSCDLVFEAVPEKLELKKEVFGKLDKILATGGHPCDEHLVASGHRHGRKHDATVSGPRVPLLQPRTGHETRRARTHGCDR